MGDYDNIINTAVEEAEKRGREVGRAEGEAKGNAEAIKTMIAAGTPVETVTNAFGMPVEECKAL